MPYAKPVYFSENGQLANVTNISGTDTIAFRQDDSTQKWDTLIVPNLLNDDNNGVFKIKGSYNSAEHDLMTFDCSTNGSSNTIKLETNRHANDIINITNSISTLEHPNDTISAIYLKATEGGIGLHWNNSKNLWAEGGRAIITANENTDQAIKLHANTGQNQTIQIINDEGTTTGSDGNGAIDIEATNGGIGLHWNDSKNLWAEGGRAIITANENTDQAIKLHADTGSNQTIQIINDEGTTTGADGNGAIDIEATNGGIGLRWNNSKNLWAEGGRAIITANENTDQAIKLHANTGSNQTIQIINDEGTTTGSDGNGAIDIEATNGGIGLHWNDSKNLWAEGGRAIITANENTNQAIKLHADAGSSQTIQIINDEGTTTGSDSAGAIDIEATNGGIGLRWNDSKRLWAKGGRAIITANENTNQAIKLHADAGSSQTIQIINDEGTTTGSDSAGAIDIEATNGGIGLRWNDSKRLWAEGGRAIITANEDISKAIILHADGGSSQTIQIINDEGTTTGSDSEGAIDIEATNGGIGLRWNDSKRLWAEGGRAIITVNENTSEAIKLHADTGSSQTIQIINDEGTTDGSYGAGAIDIKATNGGIGLQWSDSKHLWAEGGRAIITSNKNDSDAIKLHADGGSSQTIYILNDEGTSESAIQINSVAGGIDIDAAADKDINISGGQINITSKTNEANAFSVVTNEGTSETIVLQNTKGTNEAAIQLNALAGGIDIDAAAGKDINISGGQINIASKTNEANAFSVTTNQGSSETIVLQNTQGTDEASIKLNALAGGVDIDAAAGKDINISGGQINIASKTDEANAFSVTTNQGSSETIVLQNTQGTNEASIKLNALAGGVDIDAAAGKDINISGGQINVVSKTDEANAFSVVTNQGSSETIVLENTQGTNEASIKLNAIAGGVDIDAAAGKDINISGGQITITSKTNEANAFSVTTNQGSSETIVLQNTQGTDEDSIKLNALAGGVDIDAAAGKDINISGGQINIASKTDEANAFSVITNQGSSETIVLQNTQGTNEDSIKLNAIAGGVDIDAAAGKDINISGGQINIVSKTNEENAFSITTNEGTSETIVLTNTQGNSQSAIKLTASAGGLDIDTNKNITLDSSAGNISLDSTNGYISLDSKTDSNFSTSSGSLTFSGADGVIMTSENSTKGVSINSTNGTLTLNGTGQTVDLNASILDLDATNSIDINATNSIKIVSGTSGINADTTGEINIETTKSGQSAAVFTATNGGIDITAGANSTWKTTTGTLTIQGAGVSKYGDDTATLDFDGSGAVSETGMTSLTLTPSSTVTIQGAGVSKYGDDIATLDFDGSGAVSETDMTSLTLNPSGNVIIQSGGSLTYGDSVSTLVFDGSGNLANTTDLQSFQIITENSDLDSIKLASGNGGIDINASDILAIDSSTGINIGKEYANPIDIDATTLDIDASGALTLDSDTSISIGNKDDKPIDIDASTLKINTSDDTNITLTSNKVGTGTLKIEATNSGSGSSHIDMNTDGNVTINSTLGFSLDTSASEIDLTTTGTVDINSGPFTLDSSTVSIDATDDTNITLTSNKAGIGTFKIEATNNGSGSSHIDMNTDGNVTVDSTLGISLDAGNASNFTTSNGALSLFGATGVNINGNSSEIDITTTGALDINSGTFNIDSTGGPSHIISNASGANQDFEIKLTGTTTSKLGIISEGNGDDVGSSAIDISATQGGLSLLSKKTMNLTTTSANNADISIKPGGSGTLHLGKSGNTEVKIGTDTVIDGSLNCKDLSLNGSTTISENLNVLGNLNVTGNINQINSDQINILDKNIILASNNNVDSYINDAGLILKSNNDKKFTWNNDAWESTENIKINKNNSKLSFGTDSNVELTHVNNTGLLLTSGKQIQFGESGENISGDGTNLTIVSGDGIIMNATGSLTIDSAGSASNILHTGSAHGDFTIAMDGDVDASLILKSTGTAQDALQIITTQGGINITNGGAADEEEDIDITSTNSSINLTAGEAVADAIKINASNTGGGIDIDAGNKGISLNTTGILNIDSVGAASHILHTASTNGDFTIGMDGNVDASLILSSTGTGTDALQVTASAGGMDITSSGVMDITTSGNNSNINIKSHGSGTVGIGSITNTAITLDSKSFSIDAVGDASNITLATDGDEEDLTIGITGSTNSSLILSSTGTAEDALQIITTQGGINITNGGAANGEDIDITSTNSSINLTAGEAAVDAIKINASNPGSGIDIDAGNKGISLNTTGILNIDSVGSASHILHTASANGDFTIGMDGNVDASLILSSSGTGTDALQVTASAGGMDITSSGVMDITTSGNNSNISIEPHGSGVLQLGSSGGGNTEVTLDALSFSIDAYANSSHIKLASSTNNQDLTIGLTGNVDSSLVLSSSGTGTDALQVTASAGGMDITSDGVMDITTSGNNSNINIEPHGSGTVGIGSITNTAITLNSKSFSIDADGDASNITLATDGDAEDLTIGITGSTNSSLILSSTGTGTDALQVTASAGGMDITSDGVMDITTSGNNSNINIKSHGSGTVDIVDSITKITDTTQSTTNTDGSLIVSGGVGIAKNMYIAGSINKYTHLSAAHGSTITITVTVVTKTAAHRYFGTGSSLDML